MLHVTLYKYTNKPIIVDKTSLLINGLAMTGDDMVSPQNMEEPDIIIHFDSEPDYNYVYIQEYHRWYYVTLKKWVGGNAWMFKCAVDELYTYRATVKNISGIVAYSASGYGIKYDSRLVYNKPPVRVREAPNSTIKAPDKFYVVMPTIFYNSILNTYTPKNNMRYYVFPLDTYDRFMHAISNEMQHDSTKAIEAGKLIQQMSLVTWLDPNDFLYYEYVNTGYIRFDSPTMNELIAGGTLGGWNFQFDPLLQTSGYYIAYDETVHRGTNISWRVTNPVYWTRVADRNVYIPFVGKINLNLDNLGVGEMTDMYLGVNISYNFSSGSYVVTPGVASVSTGNDNFDTVYEVHSVNIPNMYATPYVVDESYQYYDTTMARQMNGMLNELFGDAIRGAITDGALAPFMAVNFGKNVANMNFVENDLRYQQRASVISVGTTNGGSPDSVYITQTLDAGGNIVKLYPSAVMETMISYPADSYNNFWSDHGKPDGAYRSLATMTGYVQMQEFEMIYDSNATIGEMQRLEAQLYKGVIL